jgi:hypothetical protein
MKSVSWTQIKKQKNKNRIIRPPPEYALSKHTSQHMICMFEDDSKEEDTIIHKVYYIYHVIIYKELYWTLILDIK